jgi:hypothetical protein
MYQCSTINMGPSGVCARVCRGAIGHLARNVVGDTMHSLSARGKVTAQLVSSVCSLMSSRCISRMASMLSRHTNFSPSALFLFPLC